MPIETERKFLVLDDSWRADATLKGVIMQGFVKTANRLSVRFRVMGDKACFTLKGRAFEGTPTSRPEYEYEIPLAEAREIIRTICDGGTVEKVRHLVEHAGRTWEVDVFAGANAGLVVAEVELPSPDAEVALPPWAGREVSDDPAYANLSLAEHPFSQWRTDHAPTR